MILKYRKIWPNMAVHVQYMSILYKNTGLSMFRSYVSIIQFYATYNKKMWIGITLQTSLSNTACNSNVGSGVLNPGAVFLRFVTVGFLLFLAPAGGPNPVGPIF